MRWRPRSIVVSREMQGTMLLSFLKKATKLLKESKFVADYDRVVLEAPKIAEEVTRRTFAHAGHSGKEKKVAVAHARALDVEQLTHHAMADVVGEESRTRHLHMMSKAQASHRKDAKTRNKTKPGEKALPKEYLTFVRCIVDQTRRVAMGTLLESSLRWK